MALGTSTSILAAGRVCGDFFLFFRFTFRSPSLSELEEGNKFTSPKREPDDELDDEDELATRRFFDSTILRGSTLHFRGCFDYCCFVFSLGRFSGSVLSTRHLHRDEQLRVDVVIDEDA